MPKDHKRSGVGKSKTVGLQWRFYDKDLLNTPSQKDFGMKGKDEIILRFKACKIVDKVGKELGM